MQTNENETQESPDIADRDNPIWSDEQLAQMREEALQECSPQRLARLLKVEAMPSPREMLRERCLILAHKGDTVGRSHKTIIERAKAFEMYVLRGIDAD